MSDATLAYRRCIPEDEVSATEKAVARVLNEWDSQGYEAYTDFSGFVARSIEGGLKPGASGRLVGDVEHQGCGAERERTRDRSDHWIDVLYQYG